MRYRTELPLTIEGKLENYAKTEGHTQRHEILWHTWHQNKRWITQLLEGTHLSFPNYSRHDESHAQTVLHNIELILGEKRVAKLSATDCFVILHTVYIHDIGMTMTAADRTEIVQNPKFMKMVDFLETQGDSKLRAAVAALKRTDYSETDNSLEAEKVLRDLYSAKLEIYNAIVHLIANYRRTEHGKKSKEYLYDWTKQSDKLGAGFSLAGMPQRIFLTIAECAAMHTEPNFSEIFKLAQEDDGYVFDYMHPRFVAVLLQLGDLLDIDNDRFHPLAMSNMDDIPSLTHIHYKKHLAIRRLHIRPDIIEIAADCEKQETLRLVRKECDMLKTILQEAGYAWSSICPANFPGSLPILKSVSLKLDQQEIPPELVMMKFQISQKRAFEILEGSSLYKDRFVFLREFVQNAIDATKCQYWRECLRTAKFYISGTLNSSMPSDWEHYVSTARFPIQIEMEISKKIREESACVFTNADLIKLNQGKLSDYTIGVNVKIKDFGTGIGREDLYSISQVGTTSEKVKKEWNEMPQWLRPTAEFGVGLQSAFLVARTFRCITHTRTEERYDITFGSGAIAQYEGYINVKPVEEFEGKKDTYGTCFEIFVPESKKMLHEECPESWDGKDIFSEGYEIRRPLHHATELMSQMALYLDRMLGKNSIFPICLKLTKPKGVSIPINKVRNNTLHAIKLEMEEQQD